MQLRNGAIYMHRCKQSSWQKSLFHSCWFVLHNHNATAGAKNEKHVRKSELLKKLLTGNWQCTLYFDMSRTKDKCKRMDFTIMRLDLAGIFYIPL